MAVKARDIKAQAIQEDPVRVARVKEQRHMEPAISREDLPGSIIRDPRVTRVRDLREKATRGTVRVTRAIDRKGKVIKADPRERATRGTVRVTRAIDRKGKAIRAIVRDPKEKAIRVIARDLRGKAIKADPREKATRGTVRAIRAIVRILPAASRAEEIMAVREGIPAPADPVRAAALTVALKAAARTRMISRITATAPRQERAPEDPAVSVRPLTSRFWIKRLPQRMITAIRGIETGLIRKRATRIA